MVEFIALPFSSSEKLKIWSRRKGKEMYKRVWCTCRVVVLLTKPIAFWCCNHCGSLVRSLLLVICWPSISDPPEKYWLTIDWLSTDYRLIDCSGRGLPTYCSRLDQLLTDMFACWWRSVTSMFLGYLLTPSLGSVSINPVTNVFVECLATHWQAFCWRIYQPTGYHKQVNYHGLIQNILRIVTLIG